MPSDPVAPPVPGLDLNADAVKADPHAALAALRETDPVHWHEPLRSWCLTRHADVEAAFKDLRFSSARIRPFVDGRRDVAEADRALVSESIGLWMVFNDPPRHTELRKLTQDAFSRRSLEAVRPRIERVVEELLDGVASRGRMDFVKDFAYPLPATVIADLLGVAREHIEDLKSWSDDLAEFVLASRIRPDKFAAAARGLSRMNELFAHLVAEKRRRPGEDLVSALVGARGAGGTLGETELIAFCVLLLFAGHETTTHYLSNGFRALLDAPDEYAKLAQMRGRSRALGRGLDELLRFDGPIVAVSRVLAEPVRLHGRTLRAGERVYLFTAAANRDPRVFGEPDRLRLDRPEVGRMLGFGFGIHLCLGLHLARMEAAVALPRLRERLPGVRLERPPHAWTRTLVMRGPKQMDVRFDAG